MIIKNIRDPQTYAIIGAAMQVHRELGHGFLEAVYQEALAIEFERRSIPYAREVDLPIYYRDRLLTCAYRADFICYGSIVVELKAISSITGNEQAQVLNYLRATRLERGLILNFGTLRMQHERMVWSTDGAIG